MTDRDKSKEELITELAELRSRIQDLKAEPERLTPAEKLSRQWERYRLISENTSDLIAVTTFEINPVFTYVSPSHEKVIGYTPEELIGKSGFDFIHPEDKKRFLPLLKSGCRMLPPTLQKSELLSVSVERSSLSNPNDPVSDIDGHLAASATPIRAV